MSAGAFESNGKPVSREAFYAVACDPRRSVAVEACAGAGKTWMLVSRILRALLDDCEPENILAITFTKKAAGEMKARLSQWLLEFSSAPDATLETELIARGVESSQVAALREPLRQLYRKLLDHDRPVQIRTFHSWFAALLRAAPLSTLQALELPQQYELLEDDQPAVALVWRRFYAALLKDSNTLADYEAVVVVHGRSQAEKALDAALRKRIEFALADAGGAVLASVPHFTEAFPALKGLDDPTALLDRDAVRTQWLSWARTLGNENNKTPQKAARAIVEALELIDARGSSDPQTYAKAHAILRKGFFVADEDRLNSNLVKFEAARAVGVELKLFCAARNQHDAWLYQQRMTRLTRVLIREFGKLKRERGWIDMNDVERAALHLLSDPVLSGWVQERLDAQTRHLLIDEFQDTNPLQWQALHAWLSGYAGSGGGKGAPSVFIVGDPKQSIYRFRRAEPQVFLAAQQFLMNQLGGDLLSCDHTRRNALGVMDLVNRVMMQAKDDGEVAGFRTHTTESSEQGRVGCLPQIDRAANGGDDTKPDTTQWRDSLTTPRDVPEETLRTLECRQVARFIAQQMAAGVPAGQIMVLARMRERLVVMQDALRELHIPAQQPEKTVLGEAPEVQDIVALLDVLSSGQHDLSLTRALKSPLFGVSDAALVRLAQWRRSQAARESWLQSLLRLGDPGPELTGIAARLTQWKTWLDTLPPHDALGAIYHDGDVLAKFAAASPAAMRQGVLGNLRALLSAALQIDAARYASPYALVRALKADGVKAPARANPDAVQLLTVHGAKGLEADMVVLLDADASEKSAKTMEVVLDWPGESASPQQFVFMASETRAPASADALMHAEAQAREREEINVLYVAMTRAKQQLVLSSVQAHRASERSWWQRVQALGCPTLVVGDATPIMQEETALIGLRVVPALVADGASPAQSTLPDPESAGKPALASRIGQAMHRLLEWAPLGARDVPAVHLARVAGEFLLDDAQAQQARNMAQQILQGEAAWAWDKALVQWQGNEVALTVQGRVGRIDRLVKLNSGTWWVLDYKSAAKPQSDSELLAQLRGYLAAVQSIYPGEKVQAAFLTANGRFEPVEGDA